MHRFFPEPRTITGELRYQSDMEFRKDDLLIFSLIMHRNTLKSIPWVLSR